jgi:DNA mismatch repair protein MutS
MALLQEYFDLTKTYKKEYGEKVIVLMQVGSFYEIYGLEDKDTKQMCNKASNIEYISKLCELNIGDKHSTIDGKNVIMIGFSPSVVDKYLKKMMDVGYTVPVYNQVEEVVTNTSGKAAASGKKVISRKLAGIYSSGTYLSTETTKITNNTTCIWIEVVENSSFFKANTTSNKTVYVGVSNIDIFTGKTSMMEFNEPYMKNGTPFDELERCIAVYNPSETIMIANLPDKDIKDILNYIGVKSTLVHIINRSEDGTNLTVNANEFIKRSKNCEKQVYQKELVERFYDSVYFQTNFQRLIEYPFATQSFCFLLDFIYQHNPCLTKKISEPTFDSKNDRLVLANHSLQQLNVIKDKSNEYAGLYSSVEKMLNKCITPMGRRQFSHDLLNPTTNVEYLEKEYEIISVLLEGGDGDFFQEYNYIKQQLGTIKDMNKLCRQIMLGKVAPKALWYLYNNIGKVKELNGYLNEDNQDTTKEKIRYYLESKMEIEHIDEVCHNVTRFLNEHLRINVCKEEENISVFEDNFIQYGINNELDEMESKCIVSLKQLEAIKDYLNGIMSNVSGTKTEYVKLTSTAKNIYQLSVTKTRSDILKKAISALRDKENVIELEYTNTNSDNSTNNTVINKFKFTISKNDFEFHKKSEDVIIISTPQTQSLCKTITSLKAEMKESIYREYISVLKKLEGLQDKIETTATFLTYIDILFTKTYIAKTHSYCRPTISLKENSFVKAKGLRHALIEKINEEETYVTNDIYLGTKEETEYTTDSNQTNGILLYGTNAVGKTSLIRAIGIAVIMAQSGMFVPCSSFVYSPYKYIFTRILGNDNLFKSLSTFEVEMSELNTILRLSDKNSLVLGDELCSGTENTSAISIFVSGIQRLARNVCSFIFATHLHEIVKYEEVKELKTVALKHMTVVYDKENDMLVYDRKLKPGAGNSMYGLEVCKSLNLPADFIENAYRLRSKYNPTEAGSILSLPTSHYNAKKIMGICEMCRCELGKEVHHLQQQKDADENGIIHGSGGDAPFHKNRLSNLMTLCESCHRMFHSGENRKEGKKGEKEGKKEGDKEVKTNTLQKRVKSSKGKVVTPSF